MTLAGLIGISILGAFVVGTLVFAALRLVFVNWRPACSGRGHESNGYAIRRCTACGGSGVLRAPKALPEEWSPERESEISSE
jgi:hypothetical protein